MVSLFFSHAALALALSQPIPGVAVERKLAERFQLKVGDTIRIATDPGQAGRAFGVEAIYLAKPDPATALRNEFGIRFHLPDLAALLGAPDRVDRIGVRAAGVSADSAAARLNRVAFGFRAYPTDSIARESSRTFLVVSRFHRAIGFVSIVASAVFLLCIMMLKVGERQQDAVVMRLIGISRGTVYKAFMLEACLLALLGSAVGIGLAYVAAAATNWIYQRRFDTALVFAHLTADIVILGVGLSLLLGLGAGALAAARLVRARPLSLWRRAA